MGQALYRKYRSKSLDDVVGQTHVTKTLAQAIKQGRISHAYLFTGPRGVGKTSVARILAHEINGLPYTDESTHLDIIEIDAASNRRIDEIRDLRDKVQIAPTSAKYKVYIIDEVHMLTREAFNALLKTLEEPPEHVVFILATTDAHKLPETIISRTQRFSFKPAEPQAVVDLLKHIAKHEKLSADETALELIAEHGGGSFRDSVSLFDQASSHGQTVDVDHVRQLLGIPPETALDALLASLAQGGPHHAVAEQLSQLYEQGYQAATIAKQLGQKLREQLLTQAVWSPATVLELLQGLLQVPSAHDPARYLEICLLRALPATATVQTPPSAPEPKMAATVMESPEVSEEPLPEPPHAEAASEPAPDLPVETNSQTTQGGGELWPQVLQALKQRHNTLYSIVRMAEPHFEGDELELVFGFSFHQNRLNEASNRQHLQEVVDSLMGRSITITARATGKAGRPAKAQAAAPTADLTTISNIFGGGELLES